MTGTVSGIIQKSGLNQSEVDARVALYQPDSGTFTPALQDNSFSNGEGQTYSEQTGTYRKIGDLCHFELELIVTSLGTLTGSDPAFIAGLPFTAASTGAHTAVTVGLGDSMAITAGHAVTGMILDNNTVITMNKWSAATGTTTVTVTEVSAGARLIASGQYICAS